MKAEFRTVRFELEDAAEDGSKFSGYAAVYGARADLGAFTETIAPGAFRKVLGAGRNVPLLWNHNIDYPLATTGAETLELRENRRGLYVEAELGHDFMSDFLRERVRRGEVAGMSFGFQAGEEHQKFERGGAKAHRVLTGFRRLLDVSPTWNPAYTETSAELRALTANAADLERLLEGDGTQHGDGPDGGEISENDSRSSSPGRVTAARVRAVLIDDLEKGGFPDA